MSKYCLDCNSICSSNAKYCKYCGYRHRVRPSGLKYKIIKVNKSWFKKGFKPINAGCSHPYYDRSTGYMKISINGKEVKYHRYVVEESIGRKLKEDEIVHHINHNKLDNRIENLQIMTRTNHLKLHHAINRWNKLFKFNLLPYSL